METALKTVAETPVLSALKARPDGFVSGQEISQWAGVSRSAVWKEIEKLREEGYKVLARPHVGYRLLAVPDRLIPEELQWKLETERIGRRVHAYEATDSTMDVAHRLAGGGAPEGTVVTAEVQRRGRGRMSRRWISPKGKGITLSVILRPPLMLEQASQMTLLAAVAVAGTVEEQIGRRPQIKWPNDVLISGRKVAGILIELNAELNRIRYCVVGIGLNVNTPRRSLPAHATSLCEVLGSRVDRIAAARTLLRRLDRAYVDFLARGAGPLLMQWHTYADFLGSRVRVAAAGRILDGQAVGLDPSGALLVRTDAGFTEAVSAGEVLVVR